MPSHRHRTETEARDGAGSRSSDTAPPMTRRSAIARVGAVGAAGPMMCTLGCGSSTALMNGQVDGMGHEQWHALVGESFELDGTPFHEDEDPHATLVLLEAADRTVPGDEHRPGHLRETTLSLLFVAPGGVALPNATYVVRHPDLGRFHLFLHEIPREAHPDKRIYEAVLN